MQRHSELQGSRSASPELAQELQIDAVRSFDFYFIFFVSVKLRSEQGVVFVGSQFGAIRCSLQ